MRRAGWALSLGLALMLGACVGGGTIPSDQFYRLEVAKPAPLPVPVLSGVVEVGRFMAEGLTGERALLYSYRDKPDQLFRHGYHLWTDAPPIMLQTQLVGLLREAHAAPVVITADLRVAPDYLIEGRLRRFEQVVGVPPAVVVAMDLGLVRLKGGELVYLHGYRVETPTPDDRPAEAIPAYQAAVSEIFTRFLADLAQHAQAR